MKNHNQLASFELVIIYINLTYTEKFNFVKLNNKELKKVEKCFDSKKSLIIIRDKMYSSSKNHQCLVWNYL